MKRTEQGEAMLGLSLAPAMCDVELPKELDTSEKVQALINRWMDRNVDEIGHVREISHVMNGWENPTVQENLSSGWTTSPDESVLSLVGVVPVIGSANGSTRDLIVCRLKPGGLPWKIRFWWDGNQQSIEAVRSYVNPSRVLVAFGRMSCELLDS